MQEDHRHAAKGRLIALMQAGHPWHEAAAMAGGAHRSIRGLPIAAQCPPARRCRLARRTAWASGQTPSTSARVPELPDGRRLLFQIRDIPCPVLDMQKRQVA